MGQLRATGVPVWCRSSRRAFVLRSIHGNNSHGYRERTGHAAQGSVEEPRRHPGQKVEIDLLLNGRLEVGAAKFGASIDSFIGCGYRPGTKPLTIEEIAEIAAEGWAGRH